MKERGQGNTVTEKGKRSSFHALLPRCGSVCSVRVPFGTNLTRRDGVMAAGGDEITS